MAETWSGLAPIALHNLSMRPYWCEVQVLGFSRAVCDVGCLYLRIARDRGGWKHLPRLLASAAGNRHALVVCAVVGDSHECMQDLGESAIIDDELAFANDRTQSRLQEMQSAQYLADHAKEHVPHTYPALQVLDAFCCTFSVPKHRLQMHSMTSRHLIPSLLPHASTPSYT